MRTRTGIQWGLAIAALTLAAGAQAAPTIIFGHDPNAAANMANAPVAQAAQASFLQALTTVSIEGFGSINATLPSATAVSGLFGGTASITQTPDDVNFGRVVGGAPIAGRFNTSPTSGTPTPQPNWWQSNTLFSLNLGSAVGAFGFYITDLGDFLGDLDIELYLGTTRVAADIFDDDLLDIAGADGSLTFFGYIGDNIRFDSIRINVIQSSTSALDVVGFDDIIIGERSTGGGTVPEPTSLALVGASLALLAGVRRRPQR